MRKLKNYVPEMFLVVMLLIISFAMGRTYGYQQCLKKFNKDFEELSRNNDTIQMELNKIIIDDIKIKSTENAIQGHIDSGVTKTK